MFSKLKTRSNINVSSVSTKILPTPYLSVLFDHNTKTRIFVTCSTELRVLIFWDYFISSGWILNSCGSSLCHGKSFSSGTLSIFSIVYFKYSSTLTPLALAVWTIEKILAVFSAPLAFLQNKKFFLAITLSEFLDNVIYPRTNIIREDFDLLA